MPTFDLIVDNNFNLSELEQINVVVGRNGSGKSTLFRKIVQNLRANPAYNVSLVSPERGGLLVVESSLQQQLRQNPGWVLDGRRQNRSDNFRQVALSQLYHVRNRWMDMALRTPEIRNSTATFESEFLDDLNKLVPNVVVDLENDDFKFKLLDGTPTEPQKLSSGESEILSLASEVLVFLQGCDAERRNIIFMDEPDPHLHPDMQARFIEFIVNRISRLEAETRQKTAFVFATHSTPFVAFAVQQAASTLGVKHFNSDEIRFKPSSEIASRVAPYVAHPLSCVFNLDRPLIVEGADDERVWQQAGRSAQDRLRIFPCIAMTVDRQNELEVFFSEFLPAIYETPIAISVRDGDGQSGRLDDVGCVKRFRLNCYAIENLLLTDESLSAMGTDWDSFRSFAANWLEEHQNHLYRTEVEQLISDGNRMRHQKIKSLANLIPGICNCTKPWHAVAGQAIAHCLPESDSEHSMSSYLSSDLINIIKQ